MALSQQIELKEYKNCMELIVGEKQFRDDFKKLERKHKRSYNEIYQEFNLDHLKNITYFFEGIKSKTQIAEKVLTLMRRPEYTLVLLQGSNNMEHKKEYNKMTDILKFLISEEKYNSLMYASEM